jgi:surface antigen
MRAFTRGTRGLLRAVLFGGALFTMLPVNVYGEPPPWAPAHGWRKKHDPYYVGYTGKRWDHDYGVITGRCNREAVGAVLGGAVGGVVGAQVGEGSARPIAILVGTIAGAVIGAHIGREMDRADRACVAHALELAGDNRRVAWPGADARTTYVLTPVRGFKQNGQTCREFNLETTRDGRSETGRGRACRTGEGAWRIIG